MSLQSDLQEVKSHAVSKGIDWDDDLFVVSFGKGTYRWLISVMGISYSDGVDIGLFDMHQRYDRKDLEE